MMSGNSSWGFSQFMIRPVHSDILKLRFQHITMLILWTKSAWLASEQHSRKLSLCLVWTMAECFWTCRRANHQLLEVTRPQALRAGEEKHAVGPKYFVLNFSLAPFLSIIVQMTSDVLSTASYISDLWNICCNVRNWTQAPKLDTKTGRLCYITFPA